MISQQLKKWVIVSLAFVGLGVLVIVYIVNSKDDGNHGHGKYPLEANVNATKSLTMYAPDMELFEQHVDQLFYVNFNIHTKTVCFCFSSFGFH